MTVCVKRHERCEYVGRNSLGIAWSTVAGESVKYFTVHLWVS